MKFNLLKRLLIFSGFIFSIVVLATIGLSLALKTPIWNHSSFLLALAGSNLLLICYLILQLKQAGIWIAHSLPSQIRFNSWPWLKTSLAAAILSLVVWMAGQLDWMPLIWDAFVTPIVMSLALFFFLWGLLAPILSKSARLRFSRVMAFMGISPLLTLVPLTGFFVSYSLVSSYFKSYPGRYNYAVEAIELAMEEASDSVPESKEPSYTSNDYEAGEPIKSLKTAVLTNTLCLEKKREVTRLLEKTTPNDQLYWAIKGLRCAELPSVIAVPKLITLMNEHPDLTIRTSAILAIGRYSNNVINNVAYLVIKKISASEPPEVVESAALVLKKIGGNTEKLVAQKLKSILNPENSEKVGHLLITYFQGQDELGQFVAENIQSSHQKNKMSAVSLICKLDESHRPHSNEAIESVVKGLGNKETFAVSLKSLKCLGESANLAIRHQIEQPHLVSRDIALTVFNQLSLDNVNTPEVALETLKSCVNDTDLKVRKLCAKGIGKIGASALPTILDLIKSESPHLKETGQLALSFMKDSSIMEQLKSLRDENSGWLATAQNLKTAESIQIAIARIEASSVNK